jgi:hypothetical protein
MSVMTTGRITVLSRLYQTMAEEKVFAKCGDCILGFLLLVGNLCRRLKGLIVLQGLKLLVDPGNCGGQAKKETIDGCSS